DGASGPGARIARAAAIRERSGCPALSKTMTARELKNRTGDALRPVGQGEQVLITRRGKPFALVVPATAAPRESEGVAGDATPLLRGRRRHRSPGSANEARGRADAHRRRELPAASVDLHHLEPRRLSRPDGAERGHAAAVPAWLNPRRADAPRPGWSLSWCATTAATSRR